MATDREARPTALEGIRVVDFTDGLAGAYATKMLADFGADVIKVEPPSGDPVRMLGPFAGDTPQSERSGLHLYLDANKRSAVIDLDTTGGRGRALDVATTANLVVESFAPGRMAALGLDHASLAKRRPDVVLLSISPFGQTGPYRDFAWSELTLFAMGAEMHSVGLAESYPLKTAANASLYYAGGLAAVAAMGALTAGRRFGVGQAIDFSIFEAHLSSIDRRTPALLAYQFTGAVTPRLGDDGEALPGGVFPCVDGFVHFYSNASMWDRTVGMLDRPQALLEPKWRRPETRSDPDAVGEFMAILYAWLGDRTKAEVCEAALQAQIIAAPLNTIEDLLADEPLRERGMWAEVEHPEVGRVTIPGRPSVWSATPWSLRRRAPLLGEHTEEVMVGLSPPDPLYPLRHGKGPLTGSAGGHNTPARDTLHSPGRRTDNSVKRLPLEGVRVIDLCASWAGPFATQLLADLGAEVIKVETIHVWQPMGRGHMARPSKESLRSMVPWSGGLPDWEPGERPWNRNPANLPAFRNKLSMTCDLRNDEGKAIFARLVAASDIIVENNVPQTLDKLGITYGWLRAIRPDVIFVRGPAFGITGPRRNARGVGASMEAFIGHTLLRCYPDRGPMGLTSIYPSDAFAGMHAAFDAIVALHHRDRTGEGQEIDSAQAECSIAMLPEYVMDYTLNGRLHESIGNRDFHGAAPSGVYPCAGEDRWVAITVQDGEGWRTLCESIGRPDLRDDAALSDPAGRRARHDELDAAIAEWTRTLDPREVMRRLQANGVPSGPVMDAADCYADPHLAARGFFETVDHDETGVYEWPGMPFKLSATPLSIRRPPCNLGEHNEYVYREVLGYSAEEYARFEREGQVGVEYDASIP